MFLQKVSMNTMKVWTDTWAWFFHAFKSILNRSCTEQISVEFCHTEWMYIYFPLQKCGGRLSGKIKVEEIKHSEWTQGGAARGCNVLPASYNRSFCPVSRCMDIKTRVTVHYADWRSEVFRIPVCSSHCGKRTNSR